MKNYKELFLFGMCLFRLIPRCVADQVEVSAAYWSIRYLLELDCKIAVYTFRSSHHRIVGVLDMQLIVILPTSKREYSTKYIF